MGLQLIGQGWCDAEAQSFVGTAESWAHPAESNFLLQRCTVQLVPYYYNVWQIRTTVEAQAWHQRLVVTAVWASLALTKCQVTD